MNSIEIDLLTSIDELCTMYESYIWHNDKCLLEVLLQDNSIAFYLYENKEVIDEFVITFGNNNKESSVYKYIAIRTILILLGNVIIYRDMNMVYNDIHKPYFKIVVNDYNLLSIIDEIILRQKNEVINENMDIILNMYTKIPFSFKGNKFRKNLKDRIYMSKMLLRTRESRVVK